MLKAGDVATMEAGFGCAGRESDADVAEVPDLVPLAARLSLVACFGPIGGAFEEVVWGMRLPREIAALIHGQGDKDNA